MEDPPILLFDPPPGWPMPTAAWQARFAGWRPEPGWRPDDAALPAPARWRYWRPGPGWRTYARPTTARLRRRLAVHSAVLTGGAITAGAALPAALPPVVGVGVGVAAIGAVGVARTASRLAAARRMLLDALHDGAAYRAAASGGQAGTLSR